MPDRPDFYELIGAVNHVYGTTDLSAAARVTLARILSEWTDPDDLPDLVAWMRAREAGCASKAARERAAALLALWRQTRPRTP